MRYNIERLACALHMPCPSEFKSSGFSFVRHLSDLVYLAALARSPIAPQVLGSCFVSEQPLKRRYHAAIETTRPISKVPP